MNKRALGAAPTPVNAAVATHATRLPAACPFAWRRSIKHAHLAVPAVRASLTLLLFGAIATNAFAAPVKAPVARQSISSQATPAAPQSTTDDYDRPTGFEMAPMPAAYLRVLAKVHEPPEMADKPMQVRKPVPPAVLRVGRALDARSDLEKASHQHRATTINELLEAENTGTLGKMTGATYGAIATLACLNDEAPKTVIGYLNKAIAAENQVGDGPRNNLIALRARMYLAEGERDKALADLQRLMVADDAKALNLSGRVKPRANAAPCFWSLASIDALGSDLREPAVKGLYLSAFITYDSAHNRASSEAKIRALYAHAARSWHSPIPYYLAAVTFYGFGGEEHYNLARCVPDIPGMPRLPKLAAYCTKYDNGMLRDIRKLTMALVIDPKFAPALAARAEKFLALAHAWHGQEHKPSLKFFQRAIADFSAALAAGAHDKEVLYVDRSNALASIGKYRAAAAGYVKGMEYDARNGKTPNALMYEQLAGVYMKLGQFKKAAHTMTQAIMNATGGLQDVVLLGGMRAFRALYPQYQLVPDEILAEAVRRRYEPQFPESWDADFIASKERPVPGTLSDFYAMRGDAYMKAGLTAKARADYARLKSDAWEGNPRKEYFNADGSRND